MYFDQQMGAPHAVCRGCRSAIPKYDAELVSNQTPCQAKQASN